MPGENLPEKLLVYDIDTDTVLIIYEPRIVRIGDLSLHLQEAILENNNGQVPDPDQMVLY